jgi:hypothetical protein
MHTIFNRKTIKGTRLLERPGRRRRLQHIIDFKKQSVRMWSGLIWLGILSSGGLL